MLIDEFHKWNGRPILDVVDYVKHYLAEHPTDKFMVMIGVDSIPHGFFKHRATFVEVIALARFEDGIGRGSHCVYRRSGKQKVSGTHERLMEEAYRLVQVSSMLRDGGIETIRNVIGLDPQLDFNKKDGWESKKYLAEAVGFVSGMGFKVNVKPDSPAASYAADHVCRYKNKIDDGIETG